MSDMIIIIMVFIISDMIIIKLIGISDMLNSDMIIIIIVIINDNVISDMIIIQISGIVINYQ